MSFIKDDEPRLHINQNIKVKIQSVDVMILITHTLKIICNK